jgi:hypothetical protein
MLTRRNRDLLLQKTEPTPFAARARDLGALRDAVVDAASVSFGLWISYLFALFYFAIAAGAVTHRDLLLESPVKLPFLNVELPLKAFFISPACLAATPIIPAAAMTLLTFSCIVFLLCGQSRSVACGPDERGGRQPSLRRLQAASPTNPVARSASVPGSGTDGTSD